MFSRGKRIVELSRKLNKNKNKELTRPDKENLLEDDLPSLAHETPVNEQCLGDASTSIAGPQSASASDGNTQRKR